MKYNLFRSKLEAVGVVFMALGFPTSLAIHTISERINYNKPLRMALICISGGLTLLPYLVGQTLFFVDDYLHGRT